MIDAVIVGGGPAGLSAALVLGRARRDVLVLDAGRPANAGAGAIGGLLGGGGASPAELRLQARAQLAELPSVAVQEGSVHAAVPTRGGVRVHTADDRMVAARALVLAGGLRYEPPPIPGIGPLWTRTVLHCPFCDGWELRGRRLAVLGAGPRAARRALLVASWSDDVLLCTDGARAPVAERAELERVGVRLREEPVRALTGRDGRLERIAFGAGADERRDALFVAPRISQPDGLAAALGCRLRDDETIVTDAEGRTGVPGVYAAGDAATPPVRSVAIAVGSGARVAHAIAFDLAGRGLASGAVRGAVARLAA